MGVSDDLRIVSGEVMPADPIREKLKALVEDWRGRDCIYDAPVLLGCAEQLAALIAESEPCSCHLGSVCGEACQKGRCHDGCKPNPNPGKTHYQGDSCPGGHESKCGYCGAPCPTCRKCPHGAGMDECPVLDCRNHLDPSAEPVLKLGHEYNGYGDGGWCGEPVDSDNDFRPRYCGQPREAH